MDASRFDSLGRSLSLSPSRRAVARALRGLALAGYLTSPPGYSDSEARKKKRKKRKKSGCKPACASPHICQAGTCTCPAGTEACNGACLPACPGIQTRNPVTCTCCQINNGSCTPAGANTDCCSGTCSPVSTVVSTCTGRAALQPCDFAAQCATGACSPGGLCLFAAS